MPYVYTITPHQKINNWGISSQWEGKHIRFDENSEGTITSLVARKKINDQTFKEYEIEILNADNIFKLANENENHYIYHTIYSAWCQGWDEKANSRD